MAQHVRMDVEWHLAGLAEPFQHAAKADRAHGCHKRGKVNTVAPQTLPCGTVILRQPRHGLCARHAICFIALGATTAGSSGIIARAARRSRCRHTP
jgi:hypothetical protein